MQALIEACLNGSCIYGDDFTPQQIQHWYDAEREAYADLGSKDASTYRYTYHALNCMYGYRYLGGQRFKNVLGLGAAWGHEFHPIIDRIDSLYIIEPSGNLRSAQIGTLKPVYSAPAVSGKIDYPDGYFDLVTCFGTLHHIPNVSFVLAELCRVTKPGGFILLREPVVSMGDWRQPRAGLTPNERGIPLSLFRNMISDLNLKVLNEGLCFTMTAFVQRAWGRVFKLPIYTFKVYLQADRLLSKLSAWNLQYHATRRLKRIAPHSVYYVLRK
ncbi:methyltransferase family protein [Mucilaginibacter yixingensis]|uniref:Methyltransferase family protein n=1 Tax=Mucilaginibacter yixingensis TaxID=1295612 RepID=A0A2T5JD66_9SPHI|nr:methyltransferase domain-containing protein [Mucilaginibacter yixingensis]PTQ99703.1 methyltransferase family protein [Mucilaginibacter yixingensis]